MLSTEHWFIYYKLPTGTDIAQVQQAAQAMLVALGPYCRQCRQMTKLGTPEQATYMEVYEFISAEFAQAYQTALAAHWTGALASIPRHAERFSE